MSSMNELSAKKDFNPLVSIVIPIYNGDNYMHEAIDSALNQTYKNIEVIVVNDGSIDDTERIALSYGDKIRYFSKENGGVATALNLAIQNAKGEYISWLSHDDVYYSDKINKQIKKLNELSDADRMDTILMSNYSLINEKSELVSASQFQNDHDINKLNYPLYPLLKGIVHGCTLLIPKHCFEDVGYFNALLKTTQDYDLWFKIFPKYKMIFMSDLFVKSRWHVDQGSKKIEVANREANELWINMIKSLSDEEKINIGESTLSFYQKTQDIVGGAGYLDAKKYLEDLILKHKHRDISEIKVSIIVPFHNRIEWTAEALRSLLDQSHYNLEIILVDDSSSDDLGVVKGIAEKDGRIKLIKNMRKHGASGARNTGIDNASGEYIAFLDSDDLFLPNKISEQVEFMFHNGFLFSHTSYSLFSSENKKNIPFEIGAINYTYPEIISNCGIATPTVMIHADLLKNIKNRFPEEYSVGEDICFWVRISKISPCIGMNKILTLVRRHESNAAFDKLKQIQGTNNRLSYAINNFLNQGTVEYIKELIQVLVELLDNNDRNNESVLIKSLDNNGRNDESTLIKHKLFLLFLKYKDIFPQAVRTAVRIKLVKLVYLFKIRRYLKEKLKNLLKRLTRRILHALRLKKRHFISIVCLIYKSTKFAKAVHDSLYKFTPELESGEAELLFVANDATNEVIDFLEKEKYNFVINNNPIFSEKELFKLGYGKPEYISRVYKGYNFGIKKCKGDIIVLVNSDNMFSPGWLENLLNKLNENTIVCSQLVERQHPKFGVFPTAIRGEFGNHPDNFQEKEFINFAKLISKDEIIPGGAYMPCMSYKKNFEKVGYYPEGNIAGKSFEEVIQYGDENLYERLKKIGIEHVTACDSISYHFKEGERED